MVAPDTGLGDGDGSEKSRLLAKTLNPRVANRGLDALKDMRELPGLIKVHRESQIADGKLLTGDAAGEHIGPGAAPFFGKRQLTEAKGARLLDQVPGHALLPVDDAVTLGGDGLNLLFDEISGEFLNRLLLFGQCEIHLPPPGKVP